MMRVALAAFLVLAPFHSQAAEPIVNHVDIPIKTRGGPQPALEEVRNAILAAGPLVASRPWIMGEAAPGMIVGWLDVGKGAHIVTVDIAYDVKRFSVAYRNSHRMDYEPANTTIHRSYNAWVKELVDQINASVGAMNPTGAADPSPVTSAAQLFTAQRPRPGDTWTYRVTYRSRRGQPAPTPSQRTHVIKVSSVSSSEILDRLVVDDVQESDAAHKEGAYLLTQGVSVFSPYYVAFHDVSKGAPFGEVSILDAPCKETYVCEATASLRGFDAVEVPAGRFVALRIVVEQRWRAGGTPANAAQMSGNRTLTAWYAPQVKRVVRYWSRSRLGEVLPVDSTFDVDLVKYELQ